jgi:prepilin-type N-terminal cleavage/methylation domain-containing protein
MMRNEKRGSAGFTLIELMITVAIVGILAASATLLFATQQLRSKRTEAMSNVEALASLARSYYGENGVYPAVAGSWPAGVPATAPVPWDAASSGAFGRLGFQAEGAVRYVYDVDAGLECPCGSGGCFTAIGYSDLEGDALIGGVGYFHRDGAGVECPTSIFGWIAPLDLGGTAQYDVAAPYLPFGIPGAPDDY